MEYSLLILQCFNLVEIVFWSGRKRNGKKLSRGSGVWVGSSESHLTVVENSSMACFEMELS